MYTPWSLRTRKIWLHNDVVRGDFLQPPHRHKTTAVVSNIKLMKGKALRKHSLHEKTAASVLLKLFISSNEWCHTTDCLIIWGHMQPFSRCNGSDGSRTSVCPFAYPTWEADKVTATRLGILETLSRNQANGRQSPNHEGHIWPGYGGHWSLLTN